MDSTQDEVKPSKNAMLKACEAGNLPALQYLFQLYDIKQGSQPAWEEREESPPRTWKMVETAIINGQVPIVAYILSVYSAGPIECEPVVRAIIDHPCMEIMKLVHQNSPGIVNLEFDMMQTFLSSACCNPLFSS